MYVPVVSDGLKSESDASVRACTRRVASRSRCILVDGADDADGADATTVRQVSARRDSLIDARQ